MPTRTQFRQQFARDLGAFGPTMSGGTATGGSATTLVDATYPVKTGMANTDRYAGWHVLRPAAAAAGDRVRMIDQSAYAPSTGTFTLDTYTNSPSGEAYELHGHGLDPWAEVDECLNEGLKLIMVPVQVPFSPALDNIPGNLPRGGRVQNLTNGNGSGAANSRLSWLLHPSWVMKVEILTATYDMVVSYTQAGATTGNYTISYGSYTTGNIAWNATAAAVQTAIQALPGLSEATVQRSGSSGSYTYTFTFVRLPRALTQFTTTIGTYDGTLTFGELSGVNSPLLVDLPGRLYLDGPHVMFDAGKSFTSSDSLYITTLVRAYDWCRASSSAAFGSQSGVSAEAHEAVPVAEWVSAAARIYAAKRSPVLMEPAYEKRRATILADAQREFDAYRSMYLGPIRRSEKLTWDEGGEPFPLLPPIAANAPEPTAPTLPTNTLPQDLSLRVRTAR